MSDAKSLQDQLQDEMADTLDEELEMELDDDRLARLLDPAAGVPTAIRSTAMSTSRSCCACSASW